MTNFLGADAGPVKTAAAETQGKLTETMHRP
jgi:hypothetical protein